MSAPEKLQTAPDTMGQMPGSSPACVWDPSRAQRGHLHPSPARGSCPGGCQTKGLQGDKTCSSRKRDVGWLPQGETFLRTHTLYGVKTNICSGGGTMAQPGRFVTPPSIIKTVSAGDVRLGTKQLALWPRGQPWPNRGVALPAALGIPRQRGPSGMRMAATQAAISARCRPGLAHGCGLCRAPLPGSTARLRSRLRRDPPAPVPRQKGPSQLS